LQKLSTLALAAVVLSHGDAGRMRAAQEQPRSEWENVYRIVVVGDLHGELDKLVLILRATGLVDRDLAWSGKGEHLVLCGDLVDKGPEDRELLDLARRLQLEAEASGGRVHVLLGNHEVMNITGDLRYVTKDGFAAFAAEANPSERLAAWERFKKETRSEGQTKLRDAFNQEYPPGYFARIRAFDLDGEYGSWLIRQPAAIKINGIVFVHGGLTTEIAALGLDGINSAVWSDIREWDKRAGDRNDVLPYVEMADALAYSSRGPLWYRGDSLENERLARTPFAEALKFLDARALVVGHTPTASRRITTRFNGRLYRTDVGMSYGGVPLVLVLEDGEAWVYDPTTLARFLPLVEPPQGEGWAGLHEEFPDDRLEEFLTKAEIGERTEIVRGDRHVNLLELERKGLGLRALFQFAEERPGGDATEKPFNPRRFQHEVAAYRLDRELRLGMVPVAVLRKIDKQPGALSIWPGSAVDLPYIRSYGRWELLQGLEPQIAKARLFSALIGARDRHDAAKMLVPPDRRIVIADNSKGFSLDTEIEDFFVTEVEGISLDPCAVDAAFEIALFALDTGGLQSLLGDLLSKEQIAAIIERRDRILAACGEAAPNDDVTTPSTIRRP
jgi:hypothetical protein